MSKVELTFPDFFYVSARTARLNRPAYDDGGDPTVPGWYYRPSLTGKSVGPFETKAAAIEKADA